MFYRAWSSLLRMPLVAASTACRSLSERALSPFLDALAISAARTLPAQSQQLGNEAGQSWLALGMELDELGLDEEAEGHLSAHAHDARH